MPRAVLSQITLNYAKLGAWDASALPVVLVHGLAASSAFWLHAAERLSQGYPVLLYDLCGHGRSSMSSRGYTPAQMAADLTELLDFLAIGRVVLAGHSFGGSVALHTALRCPDRVDRLVLADTRLRLFQPNVKPDAWPRWAERKTHFQQLGLTLDDDEPEAGVRLLIELARAEINAGDSKTLPKWVYELFGRSQSRFTATRWLELVEKTSLLSDIKHEELLTVDALKELTVPLFWEFMAKTLQLP